jgi:hypothetical protein
MIILRVVWFCAKNNSQVGHALPLNVKTSTPACC